MQSHFYDVFACSHEFAEVQKLYKQSTEHAAEQSQLIRQLEGLNLDTQRVLRNTEEAHTADTTSYQKVLAHTDGHIVPAINNYMTVDFSETYFLIISWFLSHDS